MLYKDVLIAGFGGQGVLLAGKLLAWAGMLSGKHVTWFPSYGAEMRGGTANCTVIISDSEIGSPVVDKPSVLVAMNPASAEKFFKRVPKGGVIILNSSLIKEDMKRPGVKVVRIPANELAAGLGNIRAANMVMLGAFLKFCEGVSLKSIEKALKESLPPRNQHLIPINMEALQQGFRMAEQ